MLRSSVGIGKIRMSKPLSINNASKLNKDFHGYSGEALSIYFEEDNYGNTVIKCYPQYIGIEWLIRSNIWDNRLEKFTACIDVTFNTNFFTCLSDNFTIVPLDEFSDFIPRYNNISKDISPLLGTLEDYRITAIDYRFNASLDELAPGCTVEQIVDLISRGNIPSYDDKDSHRMKIGSNIVYLTYKDLYINCRRMIVEIPKQVEHRIVKENPDFIQRTLNTTENMIRFRFQCKCHSINTRPRRVKVNRNNEIDLYRDLLSDDVCKYIISYYFNMVIGRGHWQSPKAVIAQIGFYHFDSKKEKQLVDALEFVNRCQGLTKARALCNDKAAFEQTLEDLSRMDINPVTIPEEWGVGIIWNLLEVYHSRASMERFEEKMSMKYIEEKWKEEWNKGWYEFT